MKIVILAGGFGSRLSEETHLKPKPMVEVGDRPILWHIMKSYAAAGHTDFIICCGYKGYVIKEYFANYFMHRCDVTFDLASGSMKVHQSNAEAWKVTVVDTGENTMTGGRLKRVRQHLDDETFGFTYGDGVSDVNLKALIAFHKKHGRKATLTAVQPPGRFGAIDLRGDTVTSFHEKPEMPGANWPGLHPACSFRSLAAFVGSSAIVKRTPPVRDERCSRPASHRRLSRKDA